MQKVVITGGRKMVGTYLSKELLERGFEVHVTGTSAASEVADNLVQHVCDVRDVERMADICASARYIFHLAALGDQASIDDPIEAEDINVGGTAKMLDVSRRVGAQKFVFASSAMVYGEQQAVPYKEDMSAQPTEPYGFFKLVGEEMTRFWASHLSTPAVSLRFFNVYGAGDMGPDAYVVGRFLYLHAQEKPLTIDGDGTDTRDYIHARDVAHACIIAAESNVLDGDVFNIGTGTETSLNDLAACIGGEVQHVPSRPGARRGSSRRVADISKADTVLRWKPEIPIKDGIARTKRELGIS